MVLVTGSQLSVHVKPTNFVFGLAAVRRVRLRSDRSFLITLSVILFVYRNCVCCDLRVSVHTSTIFLFSLHHPSISQDGGDVAWQGSNETRRFPRSFWMFLPPCPKSVNTSAAAEVESGFTPCRTTLVML